MGLFDETRDPVQRVAGQYLVAAFAREQHDDVLPRELCDPVQRDGSAFNNGLFGVRQQEFEGLKKIIGAQDVFVMLGFEMPGHDPGVLEFAGRRVVGIPDREGFHWLGRDPAHAGDHGAGVYPARKKGAQRHVAHETHAHAVEQHLLETRFGLRERDPQRLDVRQVPIAGDPHLAVLPCEGMAGQKLPDPREKRLVARHVPKRHVEVQTREIDPGPALQSRKDGLDLGGEQQPPVLRRQNRAA